jgi:hypothetical protein
MQFIPTKCNLVRKTDIFSPKNTYLVQQNEIYSDKMQFSPTKCNLVRQNDIFSPKKCNLVRQKTFLVRQNAI